jgi:hypothetical protein
MITLRWRLHSSLRRVMVKTSLNILQKVFFSQEPASAPRVLRFPESAASAAGIMRKEAGGNAPARSTDAISVCYLAVAV